MVVILCVDLFLAVILRAGHCVALIDHQGQLQVAQVLSVFVRARKPQAAAYPAPLMAVRSFRAITLDLKAGQQIFLSLVTCSDLMQSL